MISAWAWGCSAGRIGDAEGPGTNTHGDFGIDGQATAGSPAGSGGSAGAAGAGGGGGGAGPLDCSLASVSTAPLRRLTREQYVRTVRDLLGLPVGAENLGADERAGAFATNVSAPITELATQQYLERAEELASEAVGTQLATLLDCDPGQLGNDVCATHFIERFGRRVYRRPLTVDEAQRYQAQYATFAQSESFADAIRVVLQTMLQSPHFLYLVEFESGSPAPDEIVALGQYELATRLAYLLWGTTPDAALLDAAAAGALGDAAAVRQEATRMFAERRASDALGSFHLQWLQMTNIDTLTKDTGTYPTFDAALRSAMRAETLAFVDHVYRQGDASIRTLLTAPYSVFDGPLFDYYGVARPAGFVPGQTIALDPSQRAGILTQSAYLATHAHENQSAPVKRGVTVLRNVLCAVLPDPPADVITKAPNPAPDATTRERFAEHEKEASCASCHRSIDGIGFGFEAYDGIGRFRTLDQGMPVDDSGQILGTSDIDGPFEGAVPLVQALAQSADVEQCMARQWLRFGLGREETASDACSVQRLADSLQGSGQNLREMLMTLTTTDAFRMRRGEVL